MEGPKTGRPITVEVSGPQSERAVFEGLVATAEPEGFGFVLTPGDESAELLVPGARALVRYSDSRGTHVFEAPITAVEQGSRVSVKVAAPTQIQTQQRRRFMRLAMQLGVTVSRPGAAAPLAARTVEVGGNGATITSAEPLTAGEKLGFELDLQRWGKCTGTALVKRSVLALRPEGAEYRSALQFVELPARSQALLLSFLTAARRG